jgi:outer membrane protein assembly factor BamD (BamD/ComL family)
MRKIVATTILGAMFAAAQTQPSPQPTAAELLQKGIYTQETAGDLDGAIKIYRQIVDSHPAQREIGAQAQYRLGLTLLAKGDANNASEEIQRLGRDFPDYKELIASGTNTVAPLSAAHGCC